LQSGSDESSGGAVGWLAWMRVNAGVDVCDGSQTEVRAMFCAVGVEPGVWVGTGRVAKGQDVLPQ